ncbi:hypothetical protein ACJMK2_004161, partial [Sinanodonta woodiana]
MNKTLTANIFQRQLIENRYADAARNNDKIMHAINHVDEQTVFSLLNNIDNTNNSLQEQIQNVDTITGKVKDSTLTLVELAIHRAGQVKKR